MSARANAGREGTLVAVPFVPVAPVVPGTLDAWADPAGGGVCAAPDDCAPAVTGPATKAAMTMQIGMRMVSSVRGCRNCRPAS